eukprot:m.81738 g.81738  ORF g.81738 m.81738 type:complete len:219 (+) comp8651_c0_seq2:121-777(+)
MDEAPPADVQELPHSHLQAHEEALQNIHELHEQDLSQHQFAVVAASQLDFKPLKQYVLDTDDEKKCIEVLTTTDNVGWTPIHYCCKAGDLNMLRFFASKGARMDQLIHPPNSVLGMWNGLHIAAEHNHLDVVQYLVKEIGISVRFANPDNGFLPIHMASIHGHKAVTEFLLSVDTDDILTYTEKLSVICCCYKLMSKHLFIISVNVILFAFPNILFRM